jgi:hypothetical protein
MRTTDLFTFNRSAKRLNESLAKTFGRKLNLETFSIEQLEDARNKLRTQIYTARSGSGFNETVENDALSKAQFMHDAIVAELTERDEPIVDNTQLEGRSPEVEEFLTKVAQSGDDGFDMLYDAQAGKYGKEIEQAVQEMYDDISIDTGYHGDDDFEQIYDRMLDNIEADYGDRGSDDEGGETDDGYALASAGFGSDEDYESIETERVRDPEDWDEGNTEPPNNFAVSINGKQWKVFKGRGRYADDQRERQHFEMLKVWAAKKSADTGKKWTVSITGENPTESIQTEKFDPLKHVKNPTQGEKDAAKDVKRGSYGDRAAMLKSAEKDGRLKELSTNTLKSYQDKAGKDIVNTMTSGDYMTTDKSQKKVMNRMKGSERADNKIDKKNESINTGEDMRNLREGEIQQASAIVTAKTMVDRVGRWIEELSGMENDTLLQLGDSIRDEMSQEQAKAFIEAVAPAIQQALETLKTTRDTLSSGVRSLASGEQPMDMLGAEPGAEMGAEMGPAEPDMMNPAEPDDEFAAAEPAVGGGEAAGREQRESIQRSGNLLRVLAG